MIDIHAHILPDLDDGSEDMEESLEMAELAVESGEMCIRDRDTVSSRMILIK